MNRFFTMGLAALVAGLTSVADVAAQVFVRAPFVRVWVDGPNVQVRAPFVRIGTPGMLPPGYYYGVPLPSYVMPPPRLDGQELPPPEFTPPPPKQAATPPAPKPPEPGPDPDQAPPQPLEKGKAPTLSEFANSFTPKPGNYEVTLLNPITKEPTTVRFTLPEGSPRRIQVRDNQIEFTYGVRRFVRIEFDRDGAQVVSR